MIPKGFEEKLSLYEYLKGFISTVKLDKIEKLVSYRTNYIAPVLEDIYQYRNAGAIVRSMEAFGFQSVYALENRNSFIPEATVSKGADKWVDIIYMHAGLGALQNIKNKGYQLAAISPEKNAINIQDFQIKQPVALIYGTEFKGVTEETLSLADICIKIPMLGFTESLNVSVAAGISFYEMRNKLEKSSLDWKLSEEEKLELKIKWAIKSVSSGEEIALHYLKTFQK
ncbi:RNA methyltransferase [Apibacter raozihei]|uniref:TrmH family RNA methyltransferase n=1 Tax=Apibacter TaxID=1778601 RepID=UPI000FE3D3F0|nr:MULTISPECIES: RNA methyltransferase [Apibacter]